MNISLSRKKLRRGEALTVTIRTPEQYCRPHSNQKLTPESSVLLHKGGSTYYSLPCVHLYTDTTSLTDVMDALCETIPNCVELSHDVGLKIQYSAAGTKVFQSIPRVIISLRKSKYKYVIFSNAWPQTTHILFNMHGHHHAYMTCVGLSCEDILVGIDYYISNTQL